MEIPLIALVTVVGLLTSKRPRETSIQSIYELFGCIA
jgi:hypothetical protein